MQENIDFYRPNSTEELAVLLQKKNSRIVAGCTDVLPRMRRGQVPGDCLVDINNIKELHFILEESGQVQIGALATHAELVSTQIIHDASPALAEAAASIGSPQTRNRGTLGGNLANASPAADTAPPLLVLDAGISLNNDGKQRSVPLQDFFCGPGQTVLIPRNIGTRFLHVNRSMGCFLQTASKGMQSRFECALSFSCRGNDQTRVLPLAPRSRCSPSAEESSGKIQTLHHFKNGAGALQYFPDRDVPAQEYGVMRQELPFGVLEIWEQQQEKAILKFK